MAYGTDSLRERPELLAGEEGPDGRGGGLDGFARGQQPVRLQFLRVRTSEEDARDIAQESLARLLRYRDSEPAGAWKPLLYRIARNLLNEQWRRGYARRERENVPVDSIELPDPAPLPEIAIQQAQQQAWLREAILSLPPRCRQVFVLVRIDGLSQGEAARLCGISVTTVDRDSVVWGKGGSVR